MEPLTPAGCDLRDFPRMMVDIPRLRGSEFDATTDDSAWRAGFNLWLTAWHQVPAASLCADDASLAKAAGLGRDLRTWRKVRSIALRGWIECNDGRLYHSTVAETALEAWLEKLARRLSSGAGNAKRHNIEFDPTPVEREIEAARAMLAALNPASKSLLKQSRRVPAGSPPGARRDPDAVPPGSQEKLKGQGIYSEANASAGPTPISDPNAGAWSLVVPLIVEREGGAPSAARSFFGGLLKDHGLEPRDMLGPIGEATANGTQDVRAYLTAAAKARAKRRAEPKLSPSQLAARSNVQ